MNDALDLYEKDTGKQHSNAWNAINGVSNGTGKARHHEIEYAPCERLSPEEYERRKRRENHEG